MKKIFLLLLLLLPLGLRAQTNTPVPRLSGIVSLPGTWVALMELPGEARHRPGHLILGEGQKESGVELEKILPEQATVKVKVDGVPATLNLNSPTNRLPDAVAGMALDHASLESVLYLYERYAERTLLRWPNLTCNPFSLHASATNQTDAARVLGQALTNHHIATIPDGEKFTMVVPADRASTVKPHAPPTRSGKSASSSDLLAPGIIDFRGCDVAQAVVVYISFLGGEPSFGRLPPGISDYPVYFTTQSPLTKEQCVYALDTLLGWQNIKVLRTAEGSFKVVRADGE